MNLHTHTPNQGFEFPADKRDQIDTMLRQHLNPSPQRLQSVRADRQPIVLQPDQPEAPTVKVNLPPVTPKTEVEGISVDLPSRFAFYDFKDLYVKPFRVRHLAKMAKAHEQGSMQIMAEVVSSVLSTSSGNRDNLAFYLTVEDFNFVLYWLRLHSFSKPQMKVVSQCVNPIHVQEVEAGLKDPKSLEITTVFKETDLKITFLEEIPDPEHYCLRNEDGSVVRMRPTLVMDIVQFLDHQDWDQDAEFQFSSRAAAVLDFTAGITIDERIAYLDNRGPDDAVLALEYAELANQYGVVETITTHCIGCGASGLVKLAVDAPCFLSPQF